MPTLTETKSFLRFKMGGMLAFCILFMHLPAFSQTSPQAAIGDAAAEYGLGNPSPKSLQAQQTPKPREEGWWQAFERGWVYWHPRYGARVVKGKIFEAWAGQHWEQGPMGFPNGSEIECPQPDQHDRYQSFEGGKIYWNSRTNQATVFTNAEGFGEGGKCFAPASGRFRVVLNGFTCNQATADQSINSVSDGAGDEVYMDSKNFLVELREGGLGFSVQSLGSHRTYFYGDIGNGENFQLRTRAGSATGLGVNGGIRSGDSFPESPQKHSTTSFDHALPLFLWEGTLTRRQNAVVLIPSIWEYDLVSYVLFEPLWQPANIVGSEGIVARLIRDSNSNDPEVAKLSVRNVIAERVSASPSDLAHPLDHPIGMHLASDDQYHFYPQVFILTYDEAVRMVQLSQSKNGEAFPFTYTEPDWVAWAGLRFPLGGKYTLYLQVEKLPD